MSWHTKNEKYIYWFAAASIIYLAISLSIPSDSDTLTRYDITQTQARLLGLTITLPILAIFSVALYGFIRCKGYADSIRKTPEGPAFAKLATGLMILVFSLPISSSVSSILNYIAMERPSLLNEAAIIRNYISLGFQFTAFVYIARGADLLVNTLNRPALPRPRFGLLGTITLTSVFTWLIAIRPSTAEGNATYYLPDWLIITTLAIPYLYAWCRVLMALYHIHQYRKFVKGTIYKAALKNLTTGLGAIVVISIMIQLITTLSARLVQLSLQPVLMILYVLVALYAIGYLYVARGAKKLKLIEEA